MEYFPNQPSRITIFLCYSASCSDRDRFMLWWQKEGADTPRTAWKAFLKCSHGMWPYPAESKAHRSQLSHLCHKMCTSPLKLILVSHHFFSLPYFSFILTLSFCFINRNVADSGQENVSPVLKYSLFHLTISGSFSCLSPKYALLSWYLRSNDETTFSRCFDETSLAKWHNPKLTVVIQRHTNAQLLRTFPVLVRTEVGYLVQWRSQRAWPLVLITQLESCDRLLWVCIWKREWWIWMFNI